MSYSDRYIIASLLLLLLLAVTSCRLGRCCRRGSRAGLGWQRRVFKVPLFLCLLGWRGFDASVRPSVRASTLPNILQE